MSGAVNEDLGKERRQATFDRERLTHIIYGGKEETERRRRIEKFVFEHEAFNSPNYHYMTRDERYKEGMRRTAHMIPLQQKLGLTDEVDVHWFRSAIFPNEVGPTSVHNGMFLQALRTFADEEQQAKWLPKADAMEIIGTYAQTELGHGTFLRGLETTATYDASTQEFVLNTPRLSSMKWWPGGLGKSSNHAVVMATLVIGDKSHGMHPFFVQLRDMDTHEPLPGREIGDIGPKFGFEMNDNGFLRLDHVRIPRRNMLMKYSQSLFKMLVTYNWTKNLHPCADVEVLPDGTYVKGGHPKENYGIMVFTRARIVFFKVAFSLAQIVTIAIRYSAVRRQSELEPGATEPQILDYQTQQYRLFPQLAAAYAFIFAGRHLFTLYLESVKRIQQGDFEPLAELHPLSAGLKAFSSDHGVTGAEITRQSCGGHGYSHASGIPKILVNLLPACTYEGDNTILHLQTARYLMKMASVAQSQGDLADSVSYLGERSRPCRLSGQLTPGSLVDAFMHRAQRQVFRVADKLRGLAKSGIPAYEAWNTSSVELVDAAKAHCAYIVVKIFAEQLQKVTTPALTEVLTQLCQLYAVHLLLQHAGDFLEGGYMSSEQLAELTQAQLRLLSALRPNAIALVDAFDFDDKILQSSLGRYDGHVYEDMYKWASGAPLNKTQVHEAIHKYMKPFREGSKL